MAVETLEQIYISYVRGSDMRLEIKFEYYELSFQNTQNPATTIGQTLANKLCITSKGRRKG